MNAHPRPSIVRGFIVAEKPDSIELKNILIEGMKCFSNNKVRVNKQQDKLNQEVL